MASVSNLLPAYGANPALARQVFGSKWASDTQSLNDQAAFVQSAEQNTPAPTKATAANIVNAIGPNVALDGPYSLKGPAQIIAAGTGLGGASLSGAASLVAAGSSVYQQDSAKTSFGQAASSYAATQSAANSNQAGSQVNLSA